MPSTVRVNPSHREIKDQIRTMSKSGAFVNAVAQADMLRFVIDCHLKGTAVDEDKIGYAVFPGYVADYSTDVRTNATYLRKRLASYYENEGKDDLVIIQLLKGRQYRVACTYNTKAPAVKAYQKCLDFLNDIDFFPSAVGRLDWYLREGVEKCPQYAPIRSLNAQVTLFYYSFYETNRPSDFIQVAFNEAAAALELDPLLWRAHAALGACHACTRQWKLAKQSFDAALDLSRSDAEEDVWYLIFLVTTGQADVALETLERKIQNVAHTSCWGTIYGLVLYVLKRNSDAGEQFFQAHMDNPFAYLPRAMLGCYELTGSDNGASGGFLIEGLANLDGNSFFFKMPFRGLFVFFLAKTKPRELFAERLDSELKILDYRHTDSKRQGRPWELMMAHLALQNYEDAVSELEQAFEISHPCTMWIHLWPFLEPLRKSVRFQELIRRMNLSTSAIGNDALTGP